VAGDRIVSTALFSRTPTSSTITASAVSAAVDLEVAGRGRTIRSTARELLPRTKGWRTDSTATLGTAVVSVQASHNVAANSEAAGSKQHRLPERQASRIASEV
jgi:hypothetical protein